MEENKKNLIVTVTTANFINQAKQLFASIYFNAGWEGDYMLLTNGIAPADKAWFESKGILVYDPPLLSELPIGIKAYPSVLISKFYLFQASFKKWRTIIFLDADIIVRDSLDGLLEFNGFSAPNADLFRLRNEFISDKKAIKEITQVYDLRRRAFSTGVFAFNTDIVRQDTFSEIMNLFHKFENLYQYGEESALNLFFYRNWRMLPSVYNASPSLLANFYGIRPDKIIAFIIHFVCAPAKPWDDKSSYFQEWSENLKKAEKIDLDHRPGASGVVIATKLKGYYSWLKWKRATRISLMFLLYIDSWIGRLGLLIKKKHPKLYERVCLKKND